MKDHATFIRRQFIDSIPREGTYTAKLEAAKAFLGKNWVLHPDYKPNPRHSPANRAPLLS